MERWLMGITARNQIQTKNILNLKRISVENIITGQS